MSSITRIGLLVACTFAAVPAFAADPVTSGMRLVATCANCHGTDGVSANGEFETLPGRSKVELLAKLHAYRDGKLPSTIMQQLMKGYSAEELELIAAYLENEPRPRKK